MAFEFRFPDVGEGIHEGRIVAWLVVEGTTVALDQPLLKVETDKAVVEIPSPRAGVVLRFHAAAGEVIHVGDVLVTFGEDGDAAAPARPAAPSPAAPLPPAPVSPAESPAPAPADGLLRPPATPHTRALARRLGVDLERVPGTGANGRITDEDVQRAVSGSTPLSAPPPEPAPPPASPRSFPAPPPAVSGAAERGEAPVSGPPPGAEQRVPLTHLRKVIAEAMTAAKRTAAHVTHVDEADVTELLALQGRMRERLAASGGPRLTLLPFFLKALVAALKRFPMFNAAFDETRAELVLKRVYHLGFAVDTPEGLIAPVIRDVDRKSLTDLATEVEELARRARDRSLSLDQIRGGTCTLTNIGPVGGLFATPILRLPELAIVGTHAVKQRPAVVNGGIEARSMMYASVSFDHRFIDGAEAARFMTDFVGLLSSPHLLMARM